MRPAEKAFTLIELLAVVLILGLLASISVGVYTTQVERARIAAARTMIAELEVAINRYQIDTGQFPPSGSGSGTFPAASPAQGCGYLHQALTVGIGTTSETPYNWQGPYITVKREFLGDINGVPVEESGGTLVRGQVQILDPWRSPYRYVRSGPAPDSFSTMGGIELPSGYPYAPGYYNPSTFQISSRGSNGLPAAWNQVGTEPDDITNFGF
jgi:prepilin-type N-terminal cleavage/methylation domain-containing protein